MSDRSYVEHNLKVLTDVYGPAAPKRTVILITKGEDVLIETKKGMKKRKLALSKFDGYCK